MLLEKHKVSLDYSTLNFQVKQQQAVDLTVFSLKILNMLFKDLRPEHSCP